MLNAFTQNNRERQELRDTTTAIAIIGIESVLVFSGLLFASGILKDDPFAKAAAVCGTAIVLLVSAATIHLNTEAERRERQAVPRHH